MRPQQRRAVVDALLDHVTDEAGEVSARACFAMVDRLTDAERVALGLHLAGATDRQRHQDEPGTDPPPSRRLGDPAGTTARTDG